MNKKHEWIKILLGMATVLLIIAALANAQEKSHGKYIVVSVKFAHVECPGRDALDRLAAGMNSRYAAGYRLLGKIETGLGIDGKPWGYYALMEYNPLKRPTGEE